MPEKSIVQEKDPTENVQKLVDAAIKRLDDIQTLQISRLEAIITAHALYVDKLSVAEKGRIDALREMDARSLKVATEQAQSSASLLAEQLASTADGLRKFIDTVQANGRIQMETAIASVVTRLTELERNQYKNLGREQVSKSVIAGISAFVGALITFIAQRMMLP